MKTFLLGTVGLVALSLSAPASAADLAARPYTKAPPVIAAVYDWSGFYIGANGGWGSARNCWDFVTPAGTFIGAEGCHDATGGTAGGQIGYRWQTGTFVVGLEAQGNWADFKGSNGSLLPPVGLFTNETKIDAFGLFTGQVGYAWNNALFYVKGGAAVTADRHRTFFTPTGELVATSNNDTRWGGVAGVGLEYGFAPNWSAAIEYDHMFMGNRNVTLVNAGISVPAGAVFSNERIRQDVDLVTVRVNYRWGGPVIAKY
jgi:outer membrane immunogenic protein